MNCNYIFRLKLATIWSIPRIFQVKNTLNVAQLTHQIHFMTPYHLMYHFHQHPKHQRLNPLIRSVSRVTAARVNASSVFQLFSFLVVCSGMISKGFGFVAFFASVKASSVCIQYHFHLTCLYCSRRSALMCQITVHIHNIITILLCSKT